MSIWKRIYEKDLGKGSEAYGLLNGWVEEIKRYNLGKQSKEEMDEILERLFWLPTYSPLLSRFKLKIKNQKSELNLVLVICRYLPSVCGLLI